MNDGREGYGTACHRSDVPNGSGRGRMPWSWFEVVTEFTSAASIASSSNPGHPPLRAGNRVNSRRDSVNAAR